MEDYENIYNSICRLCLCYSNRKKMVCLIDENSQDDGLTPYAKAVSTFTNISLSKQDCFPVNMCSKCLRLLKQVIYFKFMAESSDSCLKQLKNSVRKDGQNLKEKIVEYAMINFYFPSFKDITTCFRDLKSSKEQNKIIDTENQLEKDEKVKENPVTSTNCSEDEIFDSSSPESEIEKHEFENCIKVKNSDDSKMFKSLAPVITQEVLENEESCPKSRSRAKKRRKSYLKKNITCNICNKVMASQVTLRDHMMRHNGGR